MKIVAYEARHELGRERVAAFVAGLAWHGHRDVIKAHHHEPVPCDLAVMWSHAGYLAEAREAATDYVVLENCFIGDRSRWTSAGFNGLNGDADFALGQFEGRAEVGGARFNALQGYYKPWRGTKGGRYALIMGQVPGDAALAGVDINDWYREAVEAVEDLCPFPPAFRRHPVMVERGIDQARVPGGVPVIDARMPLAEALALAALVITYNSSAAVEAVFRGVPTVATGAGSMARPVACHSLDDRRRWSEPAGRARWARNMSWCQWRIGELADGTAWKHLKWKVDHNA